MKPFRSFVIGAALFSLWALPGFSQSTRFTYQGVLNEKGVAVNGTVDLTFVLFDGVQAGGVVGATNVINDLTLTNGLFQVTLDFGGAAFSGAARWLEIAVRPGASNGSYSILRPRTPLTATPYALFSAATPASGLIGLLPSSSVPFSVARRDEANDFHGNQTVSGGRVGIGTTSPTTKLTVVEGTYGIEHTDGARRLSTYIDASGCYFGTVSADPLYFYVSDALSPLMINTNGNVGIGTSNPGEALEVAGTIKAAGFAGNGSELTGIAASALTGTLAAAQLPPTVALLDSGNTFSGNQRVISGSLDIPNGQASVGGAVFVGGNQFVAGQVNANSLNVSNHITAGSYLGDGGGLSGVAKVNGGNAFNGDQTVAAGSVGIGTTKPVSKLDVRGDAVAITVGTAANTGGSLHLGNSAHGLKRGFNGVNDVGLYTTSGDVFLSANGTANNHFVLKNSGNVGVGVLNPSEKLQVAGNVRVAGAVSVHDSAGTAKASMSLDSGGKGKLTCDYIQINGGADIAEPFDVYGPSGVQPGMIVSIHPDRPGELRLCDRAYDATVAGIISGANGIQPGLMLQQTGTMAVGRHPVALTGRVWCYCDADAGGAIAPGDLLTSADAPGHAMKATDRTRAFGSVIGKAMTPLAKGKALVLVLVSLQ